MKSTNVKILLSLLRLFVYRLPSINWNILINFTKKEKLTKYKFEPFVNREKKNNYFYDV